MNKRYQIAREFAWYFLFFSIATSLFCILPGWATTKMGLIPPHKSILWLMQVRAIFITLILTLSSFTLIQYVNQGKLSQLAKNWGIPIVTVTVLLLFLLLPNENKLYLISCCGETNPSFWGYPFGWVECAGDNFCGLVGGRIDWIYALSNFWVGANSVICIIGLAASIFKGFRKVIVIKR